MNPLNKNIMKPLQIKSKRYLETPILVSQNIPARSSSLVISIQHNDALNTSFESRMHRFQNYERSPLPVSLVPIKAENVKYPKKILKKVYGIKPITEKPLRVITPGQRIRFLCIDAPLRPTSNKLEMNDESSTDNMRSFTTDFRSRRRVVRLHDKILNPILGNGSRLKNHLNDKEIKGIDVTKFK